MIDKLPSPINYVKGVRGFLEHASFYRQFIPDFSKIARPLTDLLAKDVFFVFSNDFLHAFEKKTSTHFGTVIQPPY